MYVYKFVRKKSKRKIRSLLTKLETTIDLPYKKKLFPCTEDSFDYLQYIHTNLRV